MQDVGPSGADDRAVLAWAAQERRIRVTHDVSTVTKYAYERIRAGQSMPGVFEVSRAVPLRTFYSWQHTALTGSGKVRYVICRRMRGAASRQPSVGEWCPSGEAAGLGQ